MVVIFSIVELGFVIGPFATCSNSLIEQYPRSVGQFTQDGQGDSVNSVMILEIVAIGLGLSDGLLVVPWSLWNGPPCGELSMQSFFVRTTRYEESLHTLFCRVKLCQVLRPSP